MYVWTTVHYWPSVQHGHNVHFKTIFQIMRKKMSNERRRSRYRKSWDVWKKLCSLLCTSRYQKNERGMIEDLKNCAQFMLQVVTWFLLWYKRNQNSSHLHIYHSILTLILLTWRKWWTPNNASKWQMGFNSEFKWLNTCQVMGMYECTSWNILKRKQDSRA